MKKHAQLYSIFLEDIALIIATLLVSISLLFASLESSRGQLGIIYENNHPIKKILLNTPQIIHYKKMIFEVRENQIRIRESNCPGQICVHKGWISKKGQIIVCAPNHILIEVDNAHPF